MNVALEKYKLEKFLNADGIEYSFSRHKKNDYGEPTSEKEEYIIKGIYHEKNGYIAKTTGDTTQSVGKVQPMILCRWQDAQQIIKNDKVEINGLTHSVNKVINVGQISVYADISLEVEE